MKRSIGTCLVALQLLASTLPARAEENPKGTARDPVAEALAQKPGGLTPDEVAREASRTGYDVREKQADLRAAAARVDQALVAYFPRLSVTSTFSRLSPVENSIQGDGALVVAKQEGPLTTGPCPANRAATCVLDAGGSPLSGKALSIDLPSINHQYSFVASLSVPVSDYVLRIRQNHAAASHAAGSKRWELEAQVLQTEADARVAYYDWVRAKGQVVVAKQSVERAKAHLLDAQRLFEATMVSQADVLRLEAQVASAEKVQAQADAFLTVEETQLRTMMHAPDKPLEIGVDVLGATDTGPVETFEKLEREALANRLELRALDESRASLAKSEAAVRAGFMPRADAFADLTFANPNQRDFPQKDRYKATWDLGLRVSWAINDAFTTAGASAEARARTQAIVERKGKLTDALRMEVSSAQANLKKAGVTIESARRGLVAAEEAMRVQRELFGAGKANAVALVDADTELTRARLDRIDGHVGLEVAKVNLDHATGRDAARRAR